MPDRRPPTPLKRALAWVLLLAGFGVWLFSDTLFPGNSRLYDAIAAGDAGRVKQLLQAGANPNARDLNGRSALDLATSGHMAQVVQALVARGATPARTAGILLNR